MYVGEIWTCCLELCDRHRGPSAAVRCPAWWTPALADKRQIGALMTRMEGGKTDE